VEYTGPRVSQHEGDHRYDDRPHTFLFGLRNGKTLIDGHGLAAFINHSCDPNCYTDEAAGRVWVIALRDIAAGEELTYDYNLYDGEGAAPCHCGAATCRGTLYEPGEEPGGAGARRRKQRRNRR
jgi:SET domain-containing protein